MIIGHLPSGYIASKLLARKISNNRINITVFIAFGMLGGVAPDFDMLYFHIIDNRQHHHHTYWPHFPALWVVLLLLCTIWYRVSSIKRVPIYGLIFSACGFMHLLLDSIVGDVWWFAPFVDKPYALFIVPTLYQPWWLNFILHWSFVLEMIVVLWAIFLWKKNDKN